MSESERKCQICGETDAFPQWICLMRLSEAGRKAASESGQCSYSVEGGERIAALLEKVGVKIEDTRSAPPVSP